MSERGRLISRAIFGFAVSADAVGICGSCQDIGMIDLWSKSRVKK